MAIILKIRTTITFLCNSQVLAASRCCVTPGPLGSAVSALLSQVMILLYPLLPTSSSWWLQHSPLQQGRAHNWLWKMKHLGKIYWFKIKWDLPHQAFYRKLYSYDPICKAHSCFLENRDGKSRVYVSVLLKFNFLKYYFWTVKLSKVILFYVLCTPKWQVHAALVNNKKFKMN